MLPVAARLDAGPWRATRSFPSLPAVASLDFLRGPSSRSPGTIHRFNRVAEIDKTSDDARMLSLHEWSAMDALRAARALGLLPRDIECIGAEPERVAPGTELSPALTVAAARVASTPADCWQTPY